MTLLVVDVGTPVAKRAVSARMFAFFCASSIFSFLPLCSVIERERERKNEKEKERKRKRDRKKERKREKENVTRRQRVCVTLKQKKETKKA